MAEEQQSQRSKRQFRFKVGWYTVPALALLAFTIWLLANMSQQSGGALGSVILGIAVVVIVAGVLFKALEGPTSVD
jgi:hypothetical protein